jgi:thioredoxin-related protein
MKKILIILIISVVSLIAGNFDNAVEEAKGTKKLILVELEMEFCPYCIRMEKSVLSKRDIQDIIAEKYIFVKLNIHNDEVPGHLTSKLTPTFYFLSNDGDDILDVLHGLTKKSNFEFYLEEIYRQEVEDN